MTIYYLKNGVSIEAGHSTTTTSGYKGAAVSLAWTLNPDRPFIAFASNPSDPIVYSKIRVQGRNNWHGGHYEDPREAAYVAALFKSDPLYMDESIHQNGNWTDFPSDLYELPLTYSKEDAQRDMQNRKYKSKNNDNKTKTSRAQPLKTEHVMGAVGRALKGKKFDCKFVRQKILEKFNSFKNIDEVVDFANTLVEGA
jgi:hypothetical protein